MHNSCSVYIFDNIDGANKDDSCLRMIFNILLRIFGELDLILLLVYIVLKRLDHKKSKFVPDNAKTY